MHLWLSSYAKEKLTLRNPTLTTLKPHNCGFFYAHPLAVQLLQNTHWYIYYQICVDYWYVYL